MTRPTTRRLPFRSPNDLKYLRSKTLRRRTARMATALPETGRIPSLSSESAIRTSIQSRVLASPIRLVARMILVALPSRVLIRRTSSISRVLVPRRGSSIRRVPVSSRRITVAAKEAICPRLRT